ncbi:SWIM zinc finger family protein [Chitinophaga qingshengii]|uniref:SWIM zinc finger family protein n=1 Tax=Chitinophaga qingshengii TaxID=1569794 RepID=A0ABR7TVM0_9BACT|nr:SWIM zinc finger family protein [Chitinophaga qingshengii]MBC9934536.1 SWIM zinc finger family protein [Chitinophaga qingshengii]
MISETTISYSYPTPSALIAGSEPRLLLAGYSEIAKHPAPAFFQGHLTQPYTTARCLIALSNVVRASFTLAPAQAGMMKDPIVTAGAEKLRFEGFSQCAGVYARVDVLPGGHSGTFPANGTVNVDFNQPMINALHAISSNDTMQLTVNAGEINLQSQPEESITEKKVPLPVKWIKGLTTVQLFLAASERVHTFNKIQLRQLFQGIPAGAVKADYYLTVRGNKPVFSPVKAPKAICVGGIHRLRLLEPLLPLADELQVFVHPDMQSTTWQLYFGHVRFSLSLSREAWRGFSGEGAALDALIADVPDQLIDAMDKYSHVNQEFNPTLLAVEEQAGFEQIDQLTARLAAMGLLGFDLDDNLYFYRRLPFKLNRIMSLNPRMKDAEQLLAEDKVAIISRQPDKVEARVAGSGVTHTVVIAGEDARCTCTWFAKHQGDRGPCKHILAVRKKIN